MIIKKIFEDENSNLLKIKDNSILNKFINFLSKKQIENLNEESYILKRDNEEDVILKKIINNSYEKTIHYKMYSLDKKPIKEEKYSINGKLLEEIKYDQGESENIQYYYKLEELISTTKTKYKDGERVEFLIENLEKKEMSKQISENGKFIATEEIRDNVHIKTNWAREDLRTTILINDLINKISCIKEYDLENSKLTTKSKAIIDLCDTDEICIFKDNKIKEIKSVTKDLNVICIFEQDESTTRIIIEDKFNNTLVEKYNKIGQLTTVMLNEKYIDSISHSKYLESVNIERIKNYSINKNKILNNTIFKKYIDNREETDYGYIIRDNSGYKESEIEVGNNHSREIFYKNGLINYVRLEVKSKEKNISSFEKHLTSFEEKYDLEGNFLDLRINNKMVPLSIYKQELELNGINPEIVKNIGTLGRKKNYRQDGTLNYIQENNVLENVYSTTHYDNNNKIQSNIIIDYTNNIRVNNYYSNNKKEVTEIEFYKNSVEKIKIIKNLETNIHSYHIEKTENGTLERIGKEISLNEYNNELQKVLKIMNPTMVKEIKELSIVKKIKPSI